MKRKLRSTQGFTLMETLASLVILALMGSLLGGGISSSVRIYRQSTALSESDTLSSTLFEAISDELRFATDITTADGDLNTYTSLQYGSDTRFTNGPDGRIKIDGQDLINQLSYTGLNASVIIGYSSGLFHISLSITDPGQGGIECSRINFTIRPLNP